MDYQAFKNLNFSILGQQCTFRGNLLLNGPVTIASDIEGDIVVEDNSKLVLERTSHYKGKIKCFDIEIFGSFEGEIVAKGKIVIRSSAHVTGNLQSSNLSIYPGAVVNIEGNTLEN